MTWTDLQKLLPKAAAKHHIASTLKAIEICREYRSLAKRHLPAAADTKTSPSYKNNELTIGVPDPAWAQQLNMKRHLILDELNKKFGPRTVKQIKIKQTAN